MVYTVGRILVVTAHQTQAQLLDMSLDNIICVSFGQIFATSGLPLLYRPSVCKLWHLPTDFHPLTTRVAMQAAAARLHHSSTGRCIVVTCIWGSDCERGLQLLDQSMRLEHVGKA